MRQLDEKTVQFDFEFPSEDEYTFQILKCDEHNPRELIIKFPIYALKDDLFELRPFKGDIHYVFFGNPRLVQFANFLAREFYREHDDICRVEGGLMREYLNHACDASYVAIRDQPHHQAL